MRKLKPQGIPIDIDGKERKLLFTLNVIDELQEHYDMGIAKIMLEMYGESEEQKRKSFPMMRKVLTVLLNEDIEIHNETEEEKWEPISERYVGRRISKEEVYEYALPLIIAYNGSMPEDAKDEESDEEKNVESVDSKK